MKQKTKQIGTWIITLGIATFLVSGCAWSIGGHKDDTQATRGQELIDLKKARDMGAISDDEYQTQKKRLLGQ